MNLYQVTMARRHQRVMLWTLTSTIEMWIRFWFYWNVCKLYQISKGKIFCDRVNPYFDNEHISIFKVHLYATCLPITDHLPMERPSPSPVLHTPSRWPPRSCSLCLYSPLTMPLSSSRHSHTATQQQPLPHSHTVRGRPKSHPPFSRHTTMDFGGIT